MKTLILTAAIIAGTATMATANEPSIDDLYDTYQMLEATEGVPDFVVQIASDAFYAAYYEDEYNYYRDLSDKYKKEASVNWQTYRIEETAHEATKAALTAEIAEGTAALEEINAKIEAAGNVKTFRFGAKLQESKDNGTYNAESHDSGAVYTQIVTPVSGSYKTVTSLSVTGNYHDFDINTDGLKIHGSQANQVKFSVLVNDINDAAYNEGYSDGYNDGFQDGFNVGWDSAIDSLK